ncbi:MAG: zinc-binding dehydrogenase [Candidatus Margulisbacteria bacterium]|nr:zinc-binding dehydrogenase [Candidatus Margulisiibacteriota bacterium]
MKTAAAVLVETGKPLVLAELDIPQLKPGQVLVEIAYSGICHTQVLECRGYRGEDKFLPHCLGHEGSGIVREVGAGVSKVKAGDQVILSWIKGSGQDVPGTIYDWAGKKVNAGAITTFSRYSVISENRLTVMTEAIGLDEAALVGCAIPTGVGAVLNVAAPKPNQSLAVFGAGGVGLCAVNAAKIAGCDPLIAVDINESKLALARELGATDLINAKDTDAVKEILNIKKSGLDYAVECSGKTTAMLQAINVLRNQGGTAVIVGNARFGEKLELDPKQFNLGKRLLGTWGGDSVPDRDYPKYMKLIKTRELNVKPLMSKIYGLAEINQAVDDLEAGKVMRPLVRMT